MKYIILLFYIFLSILNGSVCHAEISSYKIFGQITTIDNQQIKGYITWSGKQMYWTDLFYAVKPNNPYASFFKNSGILFYNNNIKSPVPPNHLFTCRFGNIKSIQQVTYDKIELQVKDGHIIELTKSIYQNSGTPIRIYSEKEGHSVIKWDKISKIEFMEADLPDNSNAPITGIVKTSQGIYKGIITWDHDERTLDDLLNGKTSQGEKSIPFRNIQKITKTNNACKVRLKEGYELNMWGTNDVNNQNRGIIVNMPNIGNVRIPWKNFEAFEAVSLNEINTLTYNDFTAPERLYGKVKIKNGQIHQGIIVFDLDEAMNFEILDGCNDNITYEIPFTNIKSIEPKNYKYSFITLSNNETFGLGEKVDVDARNNGLLLFSHQDIPTYIPWKEIEKITFQD